MVATPTDQPSLGVAQERGWIDLAVRELPPGAPPVHLEWLGGQTWRALRDALRAGQGPWHVFHFVGHGGFDPAGGDEGSGEGYLALTDEASGGTYRLPADELGRLLRQQRELRLVVLNACEGARGSERELFSGTAATLVRMGVPAVVAMQHRISDRAATEFARTFYGELTRGLPVDAAAAEARAAMALASPGTQEWATPVLYLRAPDAVLFDFDLGAAPSAGEATVPAPRPAGAPGADGIPVAQKVPRTLDPAFTTLLLYIICFLYTFSYSYIIKEYYFIEDIFLVILFVGCILIGMFYSSMFLDNLNSIYKRHIAKLLFSMTIFVFSSFSYFIVLYIQLLLPHRTFGFVDLYLGIFGSYTYRVDVLTTPFFLFSMVLSLCSTIPIYIISRTGYPIGRILRSLFSL